MRTALGALGGLLLGTFAGLALSLAIVVGRAHLLRRFVHSVDELVGPLGLPVVLLAAGGALLGGLRPGRLPGAALGTVAGLVLGVTAGLAVGAPVGPDVTHPWAGGIVGGGLGATFGALFGAWRGRESREWGGGSGDDPPDRSVDSAAGSVSGLLVVLLVPLACGGDRERGPGAAAAGEETPASAVREVRTTLGDTADVESVIYLVGDPGELPLRRSPVLLGARRDLERWAGAIDPAGEVHLVVLGDMIYPVGLHPPSHPERESDSLRLAGQIALVSGPAARAAGARGWFTPGNHDWGREQDFEGAVRLERLDEFLNGWRRRTGTPVRLVPEAGTGGPAVVDVGERLRIVFLDTAWWLLEGSGQARREVLEELGRALREAGDRRVVLAAHHPFASSGPHGGLWRPLDGFIVGYLLARSGALLQDLNSRPYRELRQGLLEVFARTRRPDLFVGGHEHSLQVIRPSSPRGPLVSVVSGSASKLTAVEPTSASLFVRSAPGYARLLVLRGGTLRLEMVAGPKRFLKCPDGQSSSPRSDGIGPGAGGASDTSGLPADTASCLRRGARALETVWAGEIPSAPERAR